jgi:hypothetical protein
VNGPAAAFENLLPQAIAIARRSGRMIRSAAVFDRPAPLIWIALNSCRGCGLRVRDLLSGHGAEIR